MDGARSRFCSVCGAALSRDTPLEVCAECVVHSAFRTANVSYHGVTYTSEQEDFAANQRFGQGRFTLLRMLGAGGMGVVWLARDEHLSQTKEPIQVALKFLSPRIRSHPDAMAMLRDEVIRSRQLRHDRIVSIYDWHAASNEPAFISMEFIEGDNFSDVLRQYPGQYLPWKYIRKWMLQLCDALDYAHTKRNLVHRDLKPGNLMLTAQRELKLADFGLARVRVHHETGGLDRTQARGTPLYMSPEQMRGEAAEVSDDIYAFGATLYELLSGTPPFFGGDIFDLVQNAPPQPLAERLEMLGIASNVPEEVRDTIMFCLAKDRKGRPQTMKQVAVWLETRRPPPPARAPAPAPKRASHFRLVLGATVLMGVAAFLLWKPERPPPPPPPPPPPTPPTNAIGLLRLTLIPTNQGPTDFSLRSLAGTVPFATNGSFRGSECTIGGLPPARYLLQATNEKFVLAQRCQVETNQTNRVRLDFTPARKITVYCNKKATLTAIDCNGFRREHTMSADYVATEPCTNYAILEYSSSLPPGPWTFRLECPYYFAWETNLEVLPGTNFFMTNVLRRNFAPERHRDWTNSLGLTLVHLGAGTNNFWMSTTETTIEQFARFAASTGFTGAPMAWVSSNGWTTNPVHTWQNPLLPPGTPLSGQPVGGVNWFEATNFCAWLTATERASHSLRSNQEYRLPTSEQWALAAGPTLYPWGSNWPPNPALGNFADRATGYFQWHEHWSVLDYDDHRARTASVTFGAPNSHGLYNMGGNVAEWCLDDYLPILNSVEARRLNPFLENDGGGTFKVLRGGSWYDDQEVDLRTATLQGASPEARTDRYGFRVALVEWP